MRIAERIAESGLSLDQVCGTAGMERPRLEAILAGAEPTVVELRDLAAALGLSVSDFLPSTAPEKEVALLFRQAATRTRRKHGPKAPIENFSTRVAHAFELLPARAVEPSWLAALRPTAQTYEAAEDIASSFRDLFLKGNDLAPIPTLPEIAVTQLGVLLYLAEGSEFEGASTLLRGYPFVFVARRSFLPRMLFTLAHEIGHLIAHHSSQDFAVLDRSSDVERIKTGGRVEEAFADAFASCLLLPRTGVGIAVRKIRKAFDVRQDALGDVELLYLARLFAVSFQSAARRCEGLGLLPRGGASALYDRICKVHGSPEKYADELGLPERAEIDFPILPPILLADAIDGIRSGRVSVGRASSVLNLSIADIFQVHAGAWRPS